MPSAKKDGESRSANPHAIATEAMPIETAQMLSNHARSDIASPTRMREPSRGIFRRMVAGISMAASASRSNCSAVCLRSIIEISKSTLRHCNFALRAFRKAHTLKCVLLNAIARQAIAKYGLVLSQRFGIQNCWRTLSAEKGDGIFDGDHRHLGARFDRRGSEMRCKDDVIAAQAVADQWLALKYIESRTCNRSLNERGHKRGLLDDGSARSVDQKCRPLHFRELRGSNQSTRVRTQRYMQG